MLRIICFENEHTAAIHVGGPADISYRSFDIEAPEVEAWLDWFKDQPGKGYNLRGIQGVERLHAESGVNDEPRQLSG